MRVLLQRVRPASVSVDGETVGGVDHGLLALVGVAPGDTAEAAAALAARTAGLRVFEDGAGKMNLAVADVGGGVLVVSQFTLYADTSRGRRPGFGYAAPPAVAEPLVETFARALEAAGLPVARGVFGAHMQVHLVNDGPVTILLEG